ncbi:kinase-like domain-containing protein [Crassisporium funariophilum]|nr:kinase-like domain-containing protein [Crassisporium funariophilum]
MPVAHAFAHKRRLSNVPVLLELEPLAFRKEKLFLRTTGVAKSPPTVEDLEVGSPIIVDAVNNSSCLIDAHIAVFESPFGIGVTPDGLNDTCWFILLFFSGYPFQNNCGLVCRKVIYLLDCKPELSGIFTIWSNITVSRTFECLTRRAIRWSRSSFVPRNFPFSSRVALRFPIFLPSYFRRRSQPKMVDYRPSHIKTHSAFTFLRYSGSRLLRGARKILLDEDGFQIVHIGQGAFAVISRVWHRPSGEIRVMKRITFDKTGLAEYLARNEVDHLKAMTGNRWFPPLLNHFTDGGIYIIFVSKPFYHRGDLAGLIEHKGFLGHEIAQFYAAQLVLAIQCLHKTGIVHRDIKPDNIFLDERGHLVLADLGLAENIATFEGGEEMMAQFPVWMDARNKGGDDFPLLWVSGVNPLNTRGIAGTFWYTAPEMFRYERYSFGVDYWSVGVIYHELITGHIPFNHYRPYPENKRPILDFRIKPGQLKDITLWQTRALLGVEPFTNQFLSPMPEDRHQSVSEIKKSRLFDGVDWTRMARREIPPPLLPQPLIEG